jgi:hypothetical protein
MFNITHRFCERCERVTQDGHLWCQDRDCPAEESWPVLQYGDYLADLKILRMISVWRTAALYEAERGGEKNKQTVWVKVAHATPECEQRLRDEATYLQEHYKSVAPAPKKGFAKFAASFGASAPRQLLPQLMPASPVPSTKPFSESTLKGVPRVFCVYAPLQGVTLREAMLENPQVWHYEAAWVILTLTEALRPMVEDRKLHLSLTPRTILIDIDKLGHWRPVLLDLGWMMPSGSGSGFPRLFDRCEPAYTAPEIVADRQGSGLSQSADVYSLGIIYFEMLAGRPGVAQHWRRDDTIIRDVIESAGQQRTLPVAQDKFRPELNQAGVVGIVERAIGAKERSASIRDVAGALSSIYGNPPPEPREIPVRTKLLVGFVSILLLVVAVVAVLSLLGVLGR